MGDETKITYGQVKEMLAAIRMLDGAKEGDVVRPYKLAPQAVIATARNAVAMAEADRAFEESRVKLVRQCGGDKEGLKPGSEKWGEFVEGIQTMLAGDAMVKLCKIRASWLNIEENKLQPSLLAALMPVIVDDTTTEEKPA